ncbi:ABC transporter ATP-binding protein [Roseivivax isoporae]|uniref:Peptide ABC transporter ATP-binding protein n=1 Tax=Roseivivax isoporae LMG 25204 TaxID=1449351 RepID=X7FCW6_9RHOB|nr:ABC transporter ATP-binding protein [Roseivivax isoporae]ETX29899.1 peptide ABC transporter ATP-binding protein [Roseivivax isoporae LMG 25204]
MTEPLLDVRDLHVHFPIREGALRRVTRHVRAVDGVSLTVGRGEILGLVGESGCGKSTAGAAVLGMQAPTSGSVRFDGRDVAEMPAREIARRMSVVFQDPTAALNPRMSIGDSIGEPLAIHRTGSARARADRVAELMSLVGLDRSMAGRRPGALSGGQRQRVVIARALALDPDLVVLDEAVSALDVSIQSQILNLLLDLQARLNLSYLFISHDLSVIRHVTDRVAVMYLGRIVEEAAAEDLFAAPRHPYTAALLSAVPRPEPGRRSGRVVLPGDAGADMTGGCRFAPRCPVARPDCRDNDPALVGGAHRAACFYPDELSPDPGD